MRHVGSVHGGTIFVSVHGLGDHPTFPATPATAPGLALPVSNGYEMPCRDEGVAVEAYAGRTVVAE